MLGLRRHSFAALDSCSLLRPRYWCFPTAPFTHELMMFAYDQSTGKHFPYISVWKHFSDVSYIFAKLSVCFVPAYLSNWSSSVPFFIFGRSERTGSEKKFVLYFFFFRCVIPYGEVYKSNKVNASFSSVLGPFLQIPQYKKGGRQFYLQLRL